uniref:Transmembrane protein n=1 Tax=Steinernema glaseri TaxID=37863 RepID=A0A1I8ATD2_9BILA
MLERPKTVLFLYFRFPSHRPITVCNAVLLPMKRTLSVVHNLNADVRNRHLLPFRAFSSPSSHHVTLTRLLFLHATIWQPHYRGVRSALLLFRSYVGPLPFIFSAREVPLVVGLYSKHPGTARITYADVRQKG